MEENHNLFKSRFRFNQEYDLHLLREVCGHNPYEDSKRWSIIQVNMLQITGKSLNVRTLRERVQNLVKKYLIKAKKNEGKSGIEIEVSEIDDLLQQIAALTKEFKNKMYVVKNEPKLNYESISRTKMSYQEGCEAREKACSSLLELTFDNEIQPLDEDLEDIGAEVIVADESNIERHNLTIPNIPVKVVENPQKRKCAGQEPIATPVRKRKLAGMKQNTIHYLISKHEKNHEIKCRELVLKERRQLLEEKKHELDEFERRNRLELEVRRVEMEEKRLKMQLETFNTQQEILKLMFQKCQ